VNRPRQLRLGVVLSSGLTIIGMVAIACAVTGCSSGGTSAAQQQSLASASSTVSADTSIAPTPSSGFATPNTSTTITNIADGLTDPLTVEATGGITVNAAGAVLPDPHRTPGAINPAVTQATISTTICVTGWTTTIRPPSGYTTALKERQLASGYAYHSDILTGDYEEDHLISLELGGSPTSELNLWPEPYNTVDGARVKDVIENKLHSLVCSGALPLATAQHDIATNWWTAYIAYVGAAPGVSAPAIPPAPTAAPVTSAQAGPRNGATALCNDSSYSYAAHHQGACSHHGGVAIFYK
jgi:hypothetical protein